MTAAIRLPNQITGRVITDREGTPVPHLVVVALDFDPNRTGRLRESPGELTAATPAAQVRSVREYLVQLEKAPLDEAVHAQRLGSAPTDSGGRFTIAYQDDLFLDHEAAAKRTGVDRRPDIVLLVLGPDRPDRSGEGRSTLERLLFYTRVIGFEAGRTEHFEIRIPEDRLAEFSIFSSPSAISHSTPDQVHDELKRRLELEAEHREARTKIFKTFELPKLKKEKALFEKVLPALVPKRLGNKTNFVGFSPAKSIVSQKIYESLKLLPWLMGGNPAAQGRVGRVYLTPKDIARLGLSLANAQSLGGDSVPFMKLLNHIGYSAGPYRNRDLLSQVELKRKLTALSNVSGTPTGGGAAAPPASPATEIDLREDVLERLSEQVNALARPAEKANPANDLARIKATVAMLEQNSGPANISAMHDVEVLQVAFEPVWTAAFDASLKQKAKDLFREVAKEDIQSACGIAITPFEDIEDVDQLRQLLGDIVAASSASPFPGVDRVGKLALDLAQSLGEPYSFQYFAPGSINFGILLTYRQIWSPINYQVGRLVETVPLAPGESRTFKFSRTVRQRSKRNSRQKTSLQQLQETNSLTRTEIDVMEKTAFSMSNQTSASGQFNIGIGSIGVTSQFGINQSQEAQRIHKSFAEISRKASQEVRREVEIQFEEETSEDAISESTRTLRNPNDELTVTYLLYELERRYRVASQIHGVQPVIMVAMEMPAPAEITDAWLLEHAWIIRDVLLDKSFEEALAILEDSRSRDDAEIAIIRANYEAANAVRSRADTEFERLSQLAKSRREQIVSLSQGADMADASQASTSERVAAAFFTGGLSELFGGGQSNTDDILRAKKEAVQKSLEYLETEFAAATEARDKAMAVLNAATEKYSGSLSAKAMADQKLLQLRLHIKGNIFHYLHEIWRRRNSDDLFFSMYDLEVPFLETSSGACRLRAPTADEKDREVPGVVIDGDLYMVEISPATVIPSQNNLPKKRLIEIADVDRPLGFKGNYVLFPLKSGSLLTDFMTVGFLDGYYGVRDPAINASYSAVDLMLYAQSVWNDPVVGLTAPQKTQLAALIASAGMRNPGHESEVVLPTGQVYMEALKGGQTLLEDFKLAHRGLDVLKVEEEVRQARIDNLRRAQRIGLEKPLLDDPDIERVTLVKGLDAGVVFDPGT